MFEFKDEISQVLSKYSHSKSAFRNQYVTNHDLQKLYTKDILLEFSNADYIGTAKEKGYPVIEYDGTVYIGEPLLTEKELLKIVKK